MSAELTPEAMTAVFTRLAAKGRTTGQRALTMLALAVERAAKEDLGRASHPYGTRTPAHPGGPPALVSGTLRRIVTHTAPEPGLLGWQVKVGLAAGFYHPNPPYKGRKRTPASRVGYYLEVTGIRNGAHYPFLLPAFQRAIAETGVAEIAGLIAEEWMTGL